MSTLKGQGILIEYNDVFTSTTTTQTDLGSMATTGDGRRYRYAYTGASALVAGNLIQSPAFIANHIQLTPTQAQVVGDTSLIVTLGATLASANQYAGGYAVVTVDSGTGGLKGYQYQIKGHAAAALSTALTVNLADPLLNALTTSAKVDLVLNQFNGVIQYPTTATGSAVGVATWAPALNVYAWIQCGGLGNILNDAGGTITVGNNIVPSTSVAGAVKSATGTLPVIGYAATTVTASQTGSFYFDLN